LFLHQTLLPRETVWRKITKNQAIEISHLGTFKFIAREIRLLVADEHGIFKGTVPRVFDLWFFHESVSPKPLRIPFRPFQIFRKFAEIFAAQGAPSVSLPQVANEKDFQSEKFIYFFGTPLVS
jgi:hypothetical protein